MPNLVLPRRCPAAGLILLSTLLLLLLLWGGLAACRAASPARLADPTAGIPYLERVIQMPRGHAGLAKGELHPDGRLYFINYLSSVGVIERSRLVKLIDLPWPEGVTARHLRDLAIHPATGLVYVVESYEDVVHVLQDLDVVATIPAGGRFLKYVTVDPASPYLYVTSGTGIDGMKNTVVTVLSGTEVAGYIPLGYQPYSQFYNSVEQATYIGYYGKHIGEPMDDPPRNGVLAIVKGTEIITRTQLGYPENREINKMAVNAHTGEMYFIESDTSLIYRSATGELSRLRLKALGYGTLRDVVIDAKRGWAYVGAWKTGADRILVIERDQILAELPVATDPLALAMDETHDYVYVASRLANVFTVIRGTEVITAMRHDGIGSSQIVVDEAKGYIYVMNPDYGGRVSIFRVGVAQRQPTFWETFLPWVQSR